MTLILSRREMETLLDPAAVVAALRAAFAALGTERAQAPLRSLLDLPTGTYILYMPGYLANADNGALSTKIVALSPQNRARGLPTVQATCLLHDPTSGELLALLEAGYLTEIRTAAASALATDYLALPDAATLLIFGTGAQARAHLNVIPAVRPVARAWIAGHTQDAADAFVAQHGPRCNFPLTAIAGPNLIRDALAEARIVATCTTAATPLFDGAWLAPGTHVNAVGGFRPDTREIDTETVVRARVLVDTRAGTLAEAGELLIPLHEGAIAPNHVLAELAELVGGAATVRTRPDDITLFKSVGFAVEDTAAAWLAYSRALERGVGVQVELAGAGS